MSQEIRKISLKQAFASFFDTWNPRVAGEINNMQVKMVKLKGEFIWHHHDLEDELFLVVTGQLIMHFRDQTMVIEPGEFVIVPHGVEHLPASEEGCEILLLEPKTTLNTGNVVNERTVAELQHLS